MSETTNTGAGSSGKPKKKWVKRLLIAAAGGVVLLGGLVLLTPTLLSTGAGKGFVVGKVNDQLNGRVEIGSWSLGWFSGLVVEDVKVYDDQKRLAVSVGRLSSEMTILRAASGNYDLGKTDIDGLNLVLVEVNKDGSTNLERIAKPSTGTQTATGDAGPAGIPDVRGVITIKSMTGTIQGEAVGSPIRIEPSDVVVKLASLAEKPVETDVSLAIRKGDGPVGTIRAAGTAQAIFAGLVDTNKLAVDQQVTLSNVDLAVLRPALAMAEVALDVGGSASGSLAAKLRGKTDIQASGGLTVTQLSAGGQLLKGDTFRSEKLEVPIAVSTAGGVIKVERLGIESAELKVVVAGEIAEAALNNLSAGKAPGSAGKLIVTANVPDVAVVARQLPRTLALADGVTLTGGSVNAEVGVNLEPAAVSAVVRSKVDGVRGTSNGQGIALSPITADVDARAGFDGSGLSSLSLPRAVVDAPWVKLTASGNESALTYSADVDLDRAIAEARQFVDLGQLDAAGRMSARGTLSGALLKPGELTSESTTTLTGVRLTTAQGRIDIDRLVANAKAVVTPVGDNRFARADVQALDVTMGLGNGELLKVDATARIDLAANTAPAFDVRTLEVASLAELQRRVGAFVPALKQQGIEVASGTLRATAAGGFEGGTLTLTKPMSLSVERLTVARDGRAVLANETLGVVAMGVVSTAPGTRAELSQLAVNSSSGLVTLKQTGESLVVAIAPDGAVSGKGGLEFTADLARASELATAWTGQRPAQDVRSGRAAGRISFDQQAQSTKLTGGVELSSLTVGRAISNEGLRVTFDTASPDAFKSLDATARVESSFATADISGVKLALGGGALETVRSATIDVRSDNLAKVDALLKALTPPATVASGTLPAPELVVRQGAMRSRVVVAREADETRLDVSELKVTGLELQRGPGASFRMPGDVDLKVAARVRGSGESITRLDVTALDGSLGVANVRLAEPLAVTGIGTDAPTVAGAVTIDGRLQTVTAMLEVLQGATPGTIYPYLGDFAFTQRVSTAGDGTITLVGTGGVNNLRVLDASGAVLFAEDRLAVVNDLSVQPQRMDVTLREVSVTAGSSNAVGVRVAGAIADLGGKRTITTPLNLKLDYDLAKVTPLLIPLLDPATRDTLAGASFEGKHAKEFIVTGALPATDVPFPVGIKSLRVTGGLAVGRAVVPKMGVDLAGFDQPIALENGVLALGPTNPAAFNGGTLDVSGLFVDLTQPTPRLFSQANRPVLVNVAMNKLIGDRMGNFGSFFLKGNDDTSGRLNLTLIRADKFPLGELATRAVPENDGSLELNLTISNLKIVGGPLGKILTELKVVGALLEGELRQGKVVIANGLATQEIVYQLSAGEIKTDGGILLDSQRFAPLTVYVAPAMIDNLFRDLRLGAIGNNVRLADLPITITGTTDNPRWNVADSFGTYVKNNLTGAENIVGGIFDALRGGGGNSKPANTPPAANPAPAATPGTTSQQPNPSTRPATRPEREGILGGILQDIERERQRERERERQRRREREKEQRN